MSEYTTEKKTIVHDGPVGSRPIVNSQYESVVQDRPGMSGGAIAALVIAAVAAAVVITMLIISSQQRGSDDALAQERAKTAAAQQMPPQQAQQAQPQPITVNVPAAQQVPAPQPAVQTAPEPSSTDVEMAVTARLLGDRDLHSYSLDVKVSGGTATLSGRVQNDDLKTRAEKLAGTVKGVGSVINNITVQN